MAQRFKTIGLIGRRRSEESTDTLNELTHLLLECGYKLIIEEETASLLHIANVTVVPTHEFAKQCDVVIVIGGDGSVLQAAHVVVDAGIPVLGINRGRLGFLTDIHPADAKAKVLSVLKGEFFSEKRFLLNGTIKQKNKIKHHDIALNDVVLLPGKYSHMIEFEIYINQQLVCSQRADGQIIATPTGSTAYALSGGGPILHPSLNAVVLVPMFSHTLSARPIVVNSDAEIEIRINPDNETEPFVSWDGQERVAIQPGDSLHITKKPEELTLLHPKDHNYFETLRSKLSWQKKL